MVAPALLIAGLGILLAFFSAIANKSLVDISWHELEMYCRRSHRSGTFDDIHDHEESTVGSTESLQMFGGVTALLAITLHQASLVPPPATPGNLMMRIAGSAIIAFAIILPLIVWIPREIARCWGHEFLTNTWPIWRRVDQLLLPLTAVGSLVGVVARRLDGRTIESSEEEALEDEILSIVTEGQHDGLLENDVREMIAGVIELDDTDVADIMTPRSKMDAIPLDMPWADVLKSVVRVGRTRIPVYDKNLDDVVGLLYVKDLLGYLSAPSLDDSQYDLAKILREVSSVPRSTRLDELLQTFLRTRSHLAMVVDEYMHVVGLVTIEDVLEEIVGEIVDESDSEEPGDIRWVNDRSLEIQGRAHVEEINETMGIELPVSHEYDTIGGFILHEFGRIPRTGESLNWQNLKITIAQATKRRIERVRVDIEPPKTIGAT